GSNLQGNHAGGAARIARLHFGAEMGNGVGPQGQSYAIPTMQGGVETIKPYVDEFIDYAIRHPEQHFLVTPIGCGIAGFTPSEIAPLFEKAKNIENISLPESFWSIIND
ncbi:MAG: transcriptional regulator, partial [Bacteroidaceae bacterium]|nr:transcriptional regulator [Bacteroidaceae bacterium]